MINKFDHTWFSEHPRRRFDKFTIGEMTRLHTDLSNLSTFNQADKDVMYKFGVVGGELTSLMFVRYLCVNPSEVKPWIARRAIKHVVEFEQFRKYSADVVKWLNSQPPTTNYTSLVHIQTIIKFLTTMELQNG